MKTKWMFAVLLAMTLLGSAAFAQDRDDNDRWRNDRDQRHNRDRDHDRDRDNRDNGRHNGWRNRGDGDRDDRGNGSYRGNGGYYGRGGGYNDNAYSTGFNDGLSIGQRDRSSGHSYRPTNGSAYGDADHGYSAFGGAYGGRGDYQQHYRQGYLQGYRQGYGNSGGGYWGR